MKDGSVGDQSLFLQELVETIVGGASITRDQACRIASLKTHESIVLLMAQATVLKTRYKGRQIDLCAVVNAKSGRCPEDCIFCAQSVHHQTNVKVYSMLDADTVVRSAGEASRNGARHFGIVTSGKGIAGAGELETVCEAISRIGESTGLTPCASLGLLTGERVRQLRAAGLKRYHHNLETAESHFSKICSTHTYRERVETVRAVKEEGLEVCSGALFGLGETPYQRIELAFALRELDVDSVPLNFLNPVPGTPAESFPPVEPLDILKTVALFRFILPGKDIRVCGGREVGLRTLQPLMYLAGANGTMVGNYLTTGGRSPEIDKREIADLGLTTGLH